MAPHPRPPGISLRVSLAPLFTVSLGAFTTFLSILLTYLLQSPWRDVPLPFLSDAHYDDTQSPIFSATLTLLAASFLPTVALTTLSTHLRTPTITHPKTPRLPPRLTGRAHKIVAHAGTVAGLSAVLMLVLCAAVSARLAAHKIFVGLACSSGGAWAAAVSVTLRGGPRDEAADGYARVVIVAMQIWVVVSFAAAMALVTVRERMVSVIMEYVVLGGWGAVLLGVAWLCRGVSFAGVVAESGEKDSEEDRDGRERGTEENVEMEMEVVV